MILDDEFAFNCTLCGNCCRWEAGGAVSDNLLSCADVIRMAAYLGLAPGAFAERYGCAVFDAALRLRVVKLKKLPDGSCALLQNGRCAAYPARPRTCALFPLVRGYSFSTDESGNVSIASEYFTHVPRAPAHICVGAKVWTVREWIAANGVPERDDADRIWFTKLWRCYEQANENKILAGDFYVQAFDDLYGHIF